MRAAFMWGQAAGCVPLWPSRGIHDHAVGENARDEGRKIHPGLYHLIAYFFFLF